MSNNINKIASVLFVVLAMVFLVLRHIDLATLCMVNSVHLELLSRETK